MNADSAAKPAAPKEIAGVEFTLFSEPRPGKTPLYGKFLKELAPKAKIEEEKRHSFLVIAKVPYLKTFRYFALPFGLGRFILNPEMVDHDFGARCALCIVLPLGDTGDQSRVRAIDVKRLSANSMRMRQELTFHAPMDEFGIERSTTLVTAIRGTPADQGRGRTEFRVNWPAPSHKRGMEPGAA
ncbi:MAG: DUF6119 family protein [Vulcanimicrobiaceae bacterium]